jgi:type III pantothenate kinase
VLIANVAGKGVASEIRKVVNSLWQLEAEFIVSSKNSCGLENSYHKPEQLGVDRWMAMVAAYHMTNTPVIVVDCGTAITIDMVNENGLFVGGVIMPGLSSAFLSLKAGTDAVEEVDKPGTIINVAAQTTEDAVQSGVLLGTAGGIERVVREHSLLADIPPTVILTGGDAEKLMPQLTMPVVFQKDLVLHGLRIFLSDATTG